ncbi:MAG: exosortase J [Janthinobacterium lividum]
MQETLDPAPLTSRERSGSDVHVARRFGLPTSLSPLAIMGIASACAAAGLFTIYNTVLTLLARWRTDDLQSMGLLVPFVSFALILRAWRLTGWEIEGTWWGFALLAGSAALMFLRDQTLLVVTVHKDWLLQIPPLPLVAIVYGLGMVLLLGGRRLLRATWFPVLFLGAVLPVPQTFSRRIDLPLQHASATVARGFAHLLGEKLTPDHLRLMFTPDFGMFIAPGCNGIRGAVTLGLAAIIVGYMYRFRWLVFLPVVVGAVLLGYLFNLLRLCLLVVYYKIALPYPWLQDRAKGADYLIGACLFALALYLFFAAADRLRQRPAEVSAPLPEVLRVPVRRSAPFLAHALAILALAAIFGFDAVHAQRAAGAQTGQIPSMPASLGRYQLIRTIQDTLVTGTVVYTWGEYAPAIGGPGPHIAVGVSPELDVHDTEVCHIARGEDPTSHGAIFAPTAAGEVALVAATYNNGTVQTLEASTVCDAGQCRQYTESSGEVTLVYAHPHRTLPMQAAPSRPVPLLFKVETTDSVSPASVIEPQLAAQLKAFLREADLSALAGRFRPAR